MRPERWQLIQSLFDRAVDLEPERRRAFLDRECATDPALRNEIEALLRAEHAAGGSEFLGSAIRSAARELDERQSRTGIRLDEYRLVRELGSGGMGSVWLAERADGEYSAHVAIKLVRGGFANREIERRFRVERQILADLAHPNIARLVDGGTAPDGMPYIVMEYVDGRPITWWADENGLALGPRLRLFLTVCDAVQHAHRSLIVHRDLKPSNILVTAGGVPKLVDFGIAKLLSPVPGTAQTISMVRPMTPWYASPEQIAGDRITVGTDVYSLGVLLYELLAGVHPFGGDRASFYEVRRRILEDEPQPPSEAAAGNQAPRAVPPAALRGDLDAIVARAMQKVPERRYASVADFSDDVRRHLDGEPIMARHDSIRYRAAKLVGRYATAVGTAAAALVLVALLAGVYTVRIIGERDGARARAGRAGAAARVLLSTLRDGRPTPGARPTAEILQAADELTAFAADLLGDGRAADAETLSREALALIEPALPADHETVAVVRYRLGLSLLAQGRLDEAEQHLESAFMTLRAADGADAVMLREAGESWASLLEATGRAGEAERVRAEVHD